MIHPHTRAERKRLAEAKALQSPLFHQRKINPKRRKKLLELLEKETSDDLHLAHVEPDNTY
jgi:hypothetical protein